MLACNKDRDPAEKSIRRTNLSHPGAVVGRLNHNGTTFSLRCISRVSRLYERRVKSGHLPFQGVDTTVCPPGGETRTLETLTLVLNSTGPLNKPFDTRSAVVLC